jgi:hypothetical protein
MVHGLERSITEKIVGEALALYCGTGLPVAPRVLQIPFNWPFTERQDKKHDDIDDGNKHQTAHRGTVSYFFIDEKPRNENKRNYSNNKKDCQELNRTEMAHNRLLYRTISNRKSPITNNKFAFLLLVNGDLLF